MRLEDLKRIIKSANTLHKAKLFAKPSTGGKVNLWVYKNYERKTLGLPSIPINSKTAPDEHTLLRMAIDMRNQIEEAEDGFSLSKPDKKLLASVVFEQWINHYTVAISKRKAKIAKDKFLEANGDMSVGAVSRRAIIKMMDEMKKQSYHTNYIRGISSCIRAFCNWAEQRGFMGMVDTRKLLPPEQFGEVKALDEEELKLLGATPCEECPDVKDLFMLGVYTAQRIGEIKGYTFSMLYDCKIRARQGKTGKFIVIPLSENALGIMRGLKERREGEGKSTGEKDNMFCLPSHVQIYRIFKRWLEAAGLDRNRVTLHNCRSTAISLLINKGVPESVTQELANHADPRITARYYHQIDDTKKKEALAKIPVF
jgi:integrase